MVPTYFGMSKIYSTLIDDFRTTFTTQLTVQAYTQDA